MISEIKSWFFEKINSPTSSQVYQEKERTGPNNKIRKEKKVITDTTEIKKIIRDY